MIWARELLKALIKKQPEAKKLAEKEWENLLFPCQGRAWFLGNMTEAEWEQDFWNNMQQRLEEGEEAG